MCLTIPLQIRSIEKTMANLSDGRQVSLALIKNPQPGDWVLTNADLAISKVSEEEAKEINNYLK
ncbi:MAG: HypC/HybG/HupF family hydrogenase formation chaperone [Candidatus Buchananbacteria bacterium]|nr:HypC/HybG/HupF family hydrogenase formation chaperone [Candidatus Buchananbacteria bacterium]